MRLNVKVKANYGGWLLYSLFKVSTTTVNNIFPDIFPEIDATLKSRLLNIKYFGDKYHTRLFIVVAFAAKNRANFLVQSFFSPPHFSLSIISRLINWIDRVNLFKRNLFILPLFAARIFASRAEQPSLQRFLFFHRLPPFLRYTGMRLTNRYRF